MQSRFIQMQSRLASLKTENDEVCFEKQKQYSLGRDKNIWSHSVSSSNLSTGGDKHMFICFFRLVEYALSNRKKSLFIF